MAQYKVPQDVEAEDKLLGPFTFRQFIYLIVTVGAIALAYALFQVFPLLALIPLPVIVLFAALALPLKKDQPMETYLAAVVSFYLKPRKHFWIPGEQESTIEITAPKKVEKPRARNITEEEAGHRLSFLADLIDTEGQSIRNVDTAVRDEYIAEASAIPDILDTSSNSNINQMITQETDTRREEAINQLRAAMNKNKDLQQATDTSPAHEQVIAPPKPKPAPVLPNVNVAAEDISQVPQLQPAQPAPQAPQAPQPVAPPPSAPAQETPAPAPRLITDSPVVVQPNLDEENKPSATKQAAFKNLASNKDYSIETLAKEAKRLESQDDKEVYISLH